MKEKMLTKEKIKKLFSTGFFHIFGGNVINKVISFLSSIILVRILSKSEYGAFTYAWNIYSIILIFNGMGVDSGMLQLSSEHGGDVKYTQKVSTYGTKFGLAFNVLLSISLLVIGLFVPLKIDSGKSLLCMMCLLPMTQFICSMNSCYLRSQKRNQEFAKLAVLNTSLLFVISACGAFIFRERGLVVGHYSAGIISSIVAFSFFHVHIISRNAGNLGEDKKVLLKIGFITMVNNGLSQLLYLLDVFVLGIVDPQETIIASYKVATILPTAMTFIPLSLITYLYPYFAEHKDNGEWCIKKYKEILLYLGGLNFLISTVMFIAAPLFVSILYGKSYLDSVPVFRILAINYFFSGTFRILSGNLLVTQRKLKFNLLVAVVSSLTNAIADYFFIQWWGSIGAALATVLVVIISSVLSTSYLIYTFTRNSNRQ